jgi:hypothetical protein
MDTSSVVTLTRDGQDNTTAYKDPRSFTPSCIRNGFDEITREVSPDRVKYGPRCPISHASRRALASQRG